MTPHETYTDLMRQFWQCQREHSFQPSEMAVYFHLVDTCFMLEWKNPFKHANGYLCGVLGISEKTLISARNRLQQAGLVGFQSGKHRRDLSSYTLLQLEKAVNIPPLRAETLQPYGQKPFSLSGANTPDNGIDNKGNKSKKTPSPSKTTDDAKNDAPLDALAFDAFWQAYDKKQDRHKSAQRWEALSDADRQTALDALPAYVAATPDRKYRKNPLTWLSGRCWLDEGVPSAPAPAAAPRPALPADFDPSALFRPALSGSLAPPASPVLDTAAA